MGIDFNQVTFISVSIQLGPGIDGIYLFISQRTRRRNGAGVFKLSKIFCFTLFAWLRLSGLPLTLYLNSVYHGPRTELQPRWLCHNPRITFFFHVLNCWVRSYPVPLPPSFLGFFDLHSACSRCLVCLALEAKVPPASLPQPPHHVCRSSICSASSYLPGTTVQPIPRPLSGSMLPAWLCI